MKIIKKKQLKKIKRVRRETLEISCRVENQRRRFEKEIKDAFEFGSFNLQEKA